MTTIEIKQVRRPDGIMVCGLLCELPADCKWTKRNEYGNVPGPSCPGPGEYVLAKKSAVDELWQIADMWDRKEPISVDYFCEVLNNAGLGRKE